MSGWLAVLLGAIAGAATGALAALVLAMRIGERHSYGKARADARLAAATKIEELRDEFVQRAMIARQGAGFPAQSEFNQTEFEIGLAAAVNEARPFLSRRQAERTETLLRQLVTEVALEVATNFPKGTAYDPSGAARFREGYLAKLAMSVTQGPTREVSFPPPPGPLLHRSWSAPLMGPHHDDAIGVLDKLLILIDPRRPDGSLTRRFYGLRRHASHIRNTP